MRIDATAGEVSRAIDRASKKRFAVSLDFPSEIQMPFQSLIKFEDVVSTVNLQLEPQLDASDSTALKEVLFSPSISRWDPYAHGMDFERSFSKSVREAIRVGVTDVHLGNHVTVIHGSAACGKTSAMKRIAYDLAESGALVLWQHASFYSDRDSRLKRCFAEVAKLSRERSLSVYYFLDDPFSNGHFLPNYVIQYAERAGIRLFLVTALRTSDWLTMGQSDLVAAADGCSVVEISDDLDEDETRRLPEYLVKLGIEKSEDDAKPRCDTVSRATTDSLSLLYWLLPETRKNIAESVRDEFRRLGDRSGFRKMILAQERGSPSILRDAYAMVAVATHYNVPLPVEILVASIGVDFGDWHDATKDNGRAWGILYSEPSDDNSERYRTRNKIVTDLILETINGGMQSKAGEVRVLKELVGACAGRDGVMYREFLVQLLVPWQRLKDRLAYADGLALYDLAIDSLSLQDQSLMHHKGLWMKNVGKVPIEAGEVLTKALATNPYPYSERNEADEHIHTSIAATRLDAVDAGQLDWETGKKDALYHLEQARSDTFFNPNAVHVAARLSARIIKRSEEHEIVDSFEIAAKTLSDLERTKQVLTTPVGKMRYTRKSVEYLDSAQSSVLSSLVDDNRLEESAQMIWKSFSSQAGFVCVAHKYFSNAQEKNTDRLYRKADDFCLECRRGIEKSGERVSPELAEVHLQIVYQGQAVRRFFSPSNNRIDWIRMRDLALEASTGRDTRQHPFSKFILAVARIHVDDWIGAESDFASLRALLRGEILYEPRAVYVGPNGGPKTVQGEVKEVGGQKFISVDEIGRDIRCDSRSRWPRSGEIAHAQIRFGFAGALAFDRAS
ncbi:MAG: hypothetical protein KDA89_08035 [Planctomycetaceae bacterium]|nr:hypothetical protein [Planctomycetaceae bacterium]